VTAEPARPAAPPVVAPPVRTTPASSTGRPVLGAPPPSSPEAIEKARQALRERMKQAVPPSQFVEPAQPAVVQPSRPVAPPVEVPAAPAPMTTPTPAPTAPATPATPTFATPPPENAEALEKARQALRDRMKTSETQSESAPVVTVPSTVPEPYVVPEPSKTVKPSRAETLAAKEKEAAERAAAKEAKDKQKIKDTIGFAPLQGPASGLSAAKDQRLADLLHQYKADLVTPEEYHAQRAKILAEP
jgi:hypothetical protein